jgi:hypothetical protein
MNTEKVTTENGNLPIFNVSERLTNINNRIDEINKIVDDGCSRVSEERLKQEYILLVSERILLNSGINVR